jgi:putative DNA primase/helicase
MIDFNDAAPARPLERYDLDEIVRRLRDTAHVWVPQHFPNGRCEGDEWRLANIRGDAPHKNGSCVIALKGPHAGDWYDHDGAVGGGALSALENRTLLTNRDLYAYAANVVGWTPAAPARREPPPPSKEKNSQREIAMILSRAAPIAGTHAADYLAARGLQIPASSDLLFHDDLTHWRAKRGFPGMIAIVRNAAGEMIALHRTYLDASRPAKADVTSPRKTLGSTGGGAVRLTAPRDGLIGLAEGIETALAVMTACRDLPAWATLSTSGMEGIVLPPDIVRVVLLADHDDAGRRAAEAAAAKLVTEGRRVFIALPPREGDDFNDLLRRDGPEAVRAAVETATEIERKRDGGVAWNASLLRSRDGKILPILANAICALRNAPEWDGVLWHDEFATRTVARRPLPWMLGGAPWTDTGWSDRDDYLVTEWLQRHGIKVPASISGQAVETVARDRLFHPVP